MASTLELFADDSSSEEEVPDKKEASKEAISFKEDDDKMEEDNPAEKKSSGGDLQDSEDDDDDEPQFDDQGAVVGLKSTTLAGTKMNTEKAASRQSESPNSVQDAAVLTKTLVVQEMQTRPTNLHMTKLPNILGVQTDAFDPDTYLAAAEEEDFGQAAYNLMRWRYQKNASGHLVRDPNDQLVRESNTRLVEWEDGTYTLHVGNETFQVDMLDSSSKGFAGLNGYLYLSQTATYKAETDEAKEQSAGTVLECMGPVQSRLVVRPSSLQSEAHKSLTVGIRQKTIKKARIAEFVTHEDPEKLKLERIKVKQDLEKAAIRKNGGSGSQYPRSSTGARRPRMSREYLEEEDDGNFDTTNMKDMKKRTMGGDYEGMDDYGDDSEEYGEDEDDDDKDETFRKVRPGRRGGKGNTAKKEAAESDEDEVFLGDDEDDDEDGIAPVVKASNKKRSHQAVVDDDDDDSD